MVPDRRFRFSQNLLERRKNCSEKEMIVEYREWYYQYGAEA